MSYNDLSILANIEILARVRPVKMACMVTLPCGNVDHEPPTPKAVGQLILQCEPRYWENRVLLCLCFSKDLLVFCIGHSYFEQSGPHLRNQCTTQNLEAVATLKSHVKFQPMYAIFLSCMRDIKSGR